MIDSRTVKTPFSGGVEILVKGQMRGSSALAVASACLVLAGTIGVHFLAQFYNSLLPLAIYGTLAVVLYAPILSRIHGVSEIVAGTGFGVMGLGTYVTQSGVIDMVGVALFVPVSILVGMLLFLNEFPDVEPDRTGGRKHLVILLGQQRSAVLYVLAALATYLSIVCFVLARILPVPVLIALLTVPISYRACRLVIREHNDLQKLVPALGLNVILILTTVLLLGVGFIIAVAVG
jgi:1,4-dihydroxy-2-naphthoate octaprenyltransferase